MKPSERLLRRMRDELGLILPEGAAIRRTYTSGWAQRSAGAWSWYVVDGNGREPVPGIGSPYAVKVLLRSDSLEVGGRDDYEVTVT